MLPSFCDWRFNKQRENTHTSSDKPFSRLLQYQEVDVDGI
jgi:hypothetical protein